MFTPIPVTTNNKMSTVPMTKKLNDSPSQRRRKLFQELCVEFGSSESIPSTIYKRFLPEVSYRVLRCNSMETISSGNLTRNFKPGTYFCLCCGLHLFDSNSKYGAHGYLSFSHATKNVERCEHRDDVKRIEARCKNCFSHLGYIYRDDVSETGERFSINSAALEFEMEKFDVALQKYSRRNL
ncbi:Peptide-methionine (R)-S-oxide reductase [Aphelenchoides besseyi]|nr:Peptide-methionine (R)-S-oxide reductase [Aphelenchoides besseyi]